MPGPYAGHGTPTSIEHRAFYTYHKNPFSVAMLFGEISFANSEKTFADLVLEPCNLSHLKTLTWTFRSQTVYIYIGYIGPFDCLSPRLPRKGKEN